MRAMDVPRQQEFNFSAEARKRADTAKNFITTDEYPADAPFDTFVRFWTFYQEHGFDQNFGTHQREISQDPIRVQALLLLIDDRAENDRVAETLFYSAAIEGHINTLRFFIENGYGIRRDIRGFDDSSRRTIALHHAAFAGRLEAVTLLADNRAELNQIGLLHIGMTALELAQERGHTAIVDLLRGRGARERQRPSNIVVVQDGNEVVYPVVDLRAQLAQLARQLPEHLFPNRAGDTRARGTPYIESSSVQ
jgi:hypothetical protein